MVSGFIGRITERTIRVDCGAVAGAPARIAHVCLPYLTDCRIGPELAIIAGK
jgi:hypothetical protein